MKKIKLTAAPAIAGLLAGAAALSASWPAAAQQDAGTPSCDSLGPNPVIISGSTASKPILEALATTLHADGVPVSIIYASPDSCLGVSDLLSGTNGNESSSVYLAPGTVSSSGTATFGTPVSCTLGTSETVDIAVSDVFPQTCVNNAGLTIPSSYVEVQGPIQAMTMAVPSTSSANSISAQAAYVVFGADATNYIVSPWSVPSTIFVRAETSGTENMIGTAIGLVPSKWQNALTSESSATQQQSSTGKMEDAVAAQASTSNASATIGILSAEAVDGYNNTSPPPSSPLKILAYQHTGQSCGYLPDSSSTALDKINVRQGRYAIWGPVHFIVNTTSSGAVSAAHAAAAATVLNYFVAIGSVINPGSPAGAVTPVVTAFSGAIAGDAGAGVSMSDMQTLITAETSPGYLVPWCAMETLRTSEIGAEASYQSPQPCSCLFEETLGATVSGHTCTSCTSSSTCPSTAPFCSYGYCEVQ